MHESQTSPKYSSRRSARRTVITEKLKIQNRKKTSLHVRMQQSPRWPSRRRARIGISTAFFRPDFKGDRARSRTCVRACARGRRWKWTSGIRRVIVQTFRGKTGLPCLPIAQPDGPVFGERAESKRTKSKAKGDRQKSDPLTLCAVARGHENRASIEIVTTETRPLLSSPLPTEGNDKFAFRSSNSQGWDRESSMSITNN